jgi:hypothetical protein
MSARTILNPPLINELNDLFNGTGVLDLSAINFNNGNTEAVQISTSDSNDLVITTALNSGIKWTNSTGSAIAQLVLESNNALQTNSSLVIGSTITVGTTALQISSTASSGTGYVNLAASADFPNCLMVGENLSTATVYIDSTNTETVSLGSDTGNNLIITTAPNQGIEFSTGTGSGTITCTGVKGLTCDSSLTLGTDIDSGQVALQISSTSGASTGYANLSISPTIPNCLEISQTISALYYTGGIGMYIFPNAVPGLIAPGGQYTFPNVDIPNFIGTASSAYVVSGNYTSIPSLPFVLSISYVGPDAAGTGTYVDVQVMNVSASQSYNASFTFSIIAMNPLP